MNDLKPNISFDSPEWQRFELWLEAEMVDTYRALANTSTDHDRTQQLRGRAAFIDVLLTLGQPLPVAKKVVPAEY
jgi:hypothetical protein